MALNIKNLSHDERDVAKNIKSTKKHFIWEFVLDNKSHKIELYDSKLSNKKKLVKDGVVYNESVEFQQYSKSFTLSKHSCTLIQHGEKYELRIDNQSFNHLMDLERNKMFFGSNVSNPTSTNHKGSALENNRNSKIQFGIGNVNNQQNNNSNNSNKSNLFSFAINPVTKDNTKSSQGMNFTFGGNQVSQKQEQVSSNCISCCYCLTCAENDPVICYYGNI